MGLRSALEKVFLEQQRLRSDPCTAPRRQTASFMNRDSQLNRVGVAQIKHTRELLLAAGVFHGKPLVVVSPMRRTIETLVGLLGAEQWDFPTVVHPLAAETSIGSRMKVPGFVKKLVATIQQGDRGSTPSELRAVFPPERFASLDFSTLESYCSQMGPQWVSGPDEGKWWHHGNSDGHEFSPEAAIARGKALRSMLVREARSRGLQTVLLVSHGGILSLAFNTRSFANAEFRSFQLSDDGEILG